MWPLSKCTRCYVTTCLLWTPVGVRVVDDETRVKYLEEGRGGGAAFAGCVPWWMGWWYLGQIDRQSVCWYRRYFRNVLWGKFCTLDALFVTFLLKLRQTIFFLRSHKKKNSFYLLLRDWRWKKEAKNTPSLFIIYYRIVSKGENCASRQGNRKNWAKEGKKKLKLSILEMPFTVATSMPHFDKRSSNILAAATRKENFNLCSRRVWSAVEKRVPKKPRSWIYILPVVDAHVSEWNHVEITASTLLHRIRARVTLQSVPGAPLEGQ